MAEEKDEKTNRPKIQQSTTSNAHPLKTKISSSTSNLLSAEYNPSHNPKKDELVQSASIRILEVESLLDKLNNHIDKHHRQSSQKLQDFEQIHSELSKIQSTLIFEDKKTSKKHRNKASEIDPYIIIAPNHNNMDNIQEEKDDEKYDTIHNDTLSTLEPFQSLVHKIQRENNPDMKPDDTEQKHNSNNNNNNNNMKKRRRSSIKIKSSELHRINDYVNEHRNKMKEKTYQYEEKKKQLLNAKQRLNKAKARFKKRLNKSKQRNDRRNRAYSENKRNVRYNKHTHAKHTVSDITSPHRSPQISPRTKSKKGGKKFRVINENSDVDMDNHTKTNVSATLSRANLNKLNKNYHNGSVSNHEHNYNGNKNSSNNTHNIQTSTPIHVSMNHSPRSPKTAMISGGGYNAYYGHIKSTTNSSVTSAFSAISDQSFVDDFHSIAAELETIDDIVRNQVKSPSMTSIFSDLVSSPKQTSHSPNNSGNNNKNKTFTFSDNHVKSNMSSMSGDSESNNTKNMQSYCSSIDTSEIEADSLQSDIFHLQDIENQIGDL